MSRIRMFRECLEASKDKQYLGINFEEDALATYKEITKDKKTDKESLQFPVFKCIKTDKTEPSYN